MLNFKTIVGYGSVQVLNERENVTVPDPHRPLNKQISLSSIEEANKEVIVVTRKSPKKRGILMILQWESRKSRWGNMWQ